METGTENIPFENR